MTAEAKIPETSTDWQSIDIYVFSNGQQLSPPRKYHLHSDDLTWWEPTLMHLARLHYGSLHSCVELYTLEGYKVDSPLELTNGNAYVAVEPPDLFIDSGYNEYLIKASRSWEKHQARKMTSNKIAKSDGYKNEIMKYETIQAIDDIPIKTVNEDITAEMVQIHAVESITSVTRPIAIVDNSSSKKYTSVLKATVKKRQLYRRKAPVISKLPNSVNNSPIKRSSTIKKDHSPTTYSKIKKSPRNYIVNNENKVSLINKVSSKAYKFKTPLSVPSKVKRMSNDSSKRQSKLVLTTSVDNIILATDYVQTEAYILKNKDSELSITMLDRNNNSHRVETNEKYIHSDLIENCDIFKTTPEDTVNVVKNDASEENATTCTEANDTFCNKEIKENCILINKDDIINLKLYIEVKKEENNTKVYNNLVKKSKSLTNIFKQEKASQINLDDEIFVQNKAQSNTLESLLISKLNPNTSGDESSNIVIINCACCSYNLSKIDDSLPQNAHRKYIFLMPTLKYTEPNQRCHCEHENKEVFETGVENKEHNKSLSICNPLKKTIENMALERLSSSTKSEILIMITNQEAPKVFHKSDENNGYEPNANTVTKFNGIITEEENLKSMNIIKHNPSENEDYEKTKTIVTQKITKVPPKAVLDKYIQTKYSNMLLQARRQDDGHYTFHLPPLQLLKYYKMS